MDGFNLVLVLNEPNENVFTPAKDETPNTPNTQVIPESLIGILDFPP